VLFCEANIDGTIGGSYYSLLYLTAGLDRHVFEPIVAFHRDHALVPRFREHGIGVHILAQPKVFRLVTPRCVEKSPVGVAVFSAMRKGANALNFLLATIRWVNFLRKRRIELVHLNNSVTENHEWMLAALLTATPCVTHQRGMPRRFQVAGRLLSRQLKAILCISGAVRDHLAQHRITGPHVQVVPNGLDTALMTTDRSPERIRAEYGIPDGTRLIGMVGNLNGWKGQEVVIRALPAIISRFPNVVCMFVGAAPPSGEDFERRLRQLVESLSLTSHVMFTGYRSGVADILNAFEVPIHASIEPEPFGRVIIEAMALRKAIVASRAGAVPEIVVEGVTGLMFEPGNSEELADAVIKLLGNPSRARAFGNAALRRLHTHYSLEQNLFRTMQVYRQALDKPERRRALLIGQPATR
jgi:glycosyltransferase involved in cell wall biosynthesis